VFALLLIAGAACDKKEQKTTQLEAPGSLARPPAAGALAADLYPPGHNK
jgi:hypothetical protein